MERPGYIVLYIITVFSPSLYLDANHHTTTPLRLATLRYATESKHTAEYAQTRKPRVQTGRCGVTLHLHLHLHLHCICKRPPATTPYLTTSTPTPTPTLAAAVRPRLHLHPSQRILCHQWCDNGVSEEQDHTRFFFPSACG